MTIRGKQLRETEIKKALEYIKQDWKYYIDLWIDVEPWRVGTIFAPCTRASSVSPDKSMNGGLRLLGWTFVSAFGGKV